MSEKACNYCVQEFWAVIFGFDGHVGAIPTQRVYRLSDLYTNCVVYWHINRGYMIKNNIST